MKNVVKNLLALIFFITLNYGLPKSEFTIGGIFNENEYDLERAFESAIAVTDEFDVENIYKAKIGRTQDVYSAARMVCNMTATDAGVVGIFGPDSSKTHPVIQSVCNNFEIPYIQVNWMPTSTSSLATSLNFFPDTDLYVKGLGVLVQHLMWKSFVILYEEDEALIRLQDVLKLQVMDKSKPLNTITVRKLDPMGDHRTILKDIKNSTELNIILDCKTENILHVLRQAKEVKLLEYYHNYLLTSLDAHIIDYSSLNTTTNITTVRIFDTANAELIRATQHWQQLERLRRNFDSNIDPKHIKAKVALTHDAIQLFLKALYQLDITQVIVSESFNCENPSTWSDGLRIVEYMKYLHFENSITGPVKFNEWGKRIDFSLYLVERKNEEFRTTAIWRPQLGNSLNYTRSDLENQLQIEEDLQKTLVIVTSRIGPPYLRLREPKDGEILEGNARYEGYSMDLIAAIGDILNFTFKFELAKDKKYGKYNPKTKQWDGLIKDLLDRKAHLAICDLTITHERREVVDFSLPFMTLGISILYKKATKEPPSVFAFMDPFSFDVWVYTVTLYLAVSIMLYFIARMAPGDWENPHPCDQNPEELENMWDLKNCLWLTLGSIMTQGCDILPKGISSRMTTSLWWFFSLIMTSSYTANLAAFLTADKMGPTIDSAEALAKQTKIKYGTVEDGATQAFFRESNFTTYQRMWTQMLASKPSVFEKSNADGVKRVRTTKNSLYAFLMESSSIEYEVEKSCDLKQVGGWLDNKGYGIAMPMNSKYRSSINRAILRLSEEGKLRELKNKWWKLKNPKEDCEEQDETKNSGKLDLEKVGGVFLVLGLGIVVAMILAVIEFLWNVRNITVEEHITYKEALAHELQFAINIWEMQKQVKPQLSDKSRASSKSSSKDIDGRVDITRF